MSPWSSSADTDDDALVASQDSKLQSFLVRAFTSRARCRLSSVSRGLLPEAPVLLRSGSSSSRQGRGDPAGPERRRSPHEAGRAVNRAGERLAYLENDWSLVDSVGTRR